MNFSYPKISIITPSLNQGQFIERCILSVLNQNYPNLEYIIMDGGSTDGTIEIIRKYEKYLALWTSAPDKGQVSAINNGFSRATGEIVAWFNCDDFYYPGVLTKIANEFKENPAIGMLYGDAIIVDYNGKPLIKQTPNGINLRLLSLDCYIAQPSTFIRKTLLEKICFLDESLDYCFDYDFWIRIFKYDKTKYLPLSISGITVSASYDNKTFNHWGETIKYTARIQTKHFGSPSYKMYASLAAFKSVNYIPHIDNKDLSFLFYVGGIVKYMQCNISSPIKLFRQLNAILNLIYLRLIRGIYTWKRIKGIDHETA